MVLKRPISENMHFIQYGGERISFSLIYNARKTLKIDVFPDKTVRVFAPAGKNLDEVMKRVRKKAAWILKQIDYFGRFHPLPPEKRYESGETHRYLGRQYRLKILWNETNGVKIIGKYFHVNVSQKHDKDKVRLLLERWYREHARKVLFHRIEICYESFNRMGIEFPHVIIRKMKRRWGSCGSKRTILLNPDLVKAPIHCIDYVIMHELCHLKYRDHGKKFRRLLTLLMPDWKKRKERLESNVF